MALLFPPGKQKQAAESRDTVMARMGRLNQGWPLTPFSQVLSCQPGMAVRGLRESGRGVWHAVILQGGLSQHQCDFRWAQPGLALMMSFWYAAPTTLPGSHYPASVLLPVCAEPRLCVELWF